MEHPHPLVLSLTHQAIMGVVRRNTSMPVAACGASELVGRPGGHCMPTFFMSCGTDCLAFLGETCNESERQRDSVAKSAPVPMQYYCNALISRSSSNFGIVA
eukprot:567327-Amphidinium_carterae.1